MVVMSMLGVVCTSVPWSVCACARSWWYVMHVLVCHGLCMYACHGHHTYACAMVCVCMCAMVVVCGGVCHGALCVVVCTGAYVLVCGGTYTGTLLCAVPTQQRCQYIPHCIGRIAIQCTCVQYMAVYRTHVQQYLHTHWYTEQALWFNAVTCTYTHNGHIG